MTLTAKKCVILMASKRPEDVILMAAFRLLIARSGFR